MNRRDAIKAMGALAGSAAASRLLAGCAQPLTLGTDAAGLGVNPASFGILHADSSWRTSWTHIIPGRFTVAATTSLFFYEGSTGYGEFWVTDGAGGLGGTSPLATYTAA